MDTPLPVLPPDPSCTLCELHTGATSICVPMAPHSITGTHKTALLVVGEAPGRNEDEQNTPFVGMAGETLRKVYLEATDLPSTCDIFLTNSVRCRPPMNATPVKKHMKACKPYLLHDLETLRTAYQEVVILCAGAVATRTISNCSQKQGFSRQGDYTTIGDHEYRVFHSYHPSYLNRRRSPASINAVADHMDYLRRYLRGQDSFEIPLIPDPPLAPNPPSRIDGPIALDIETYGILASMPVQRHFHPRKSHILDGVPKHRLVVTVGLSWKGVGGDLETAVFRMSDPHHRDVFSKWLKLISRDQIPILGMNLKFDLQYLRYAYPAWKYFFLTHGHPVIDISILNFLHSDVRPEKSLKNLAPLFGVSRYGESAKNHRYRDDKDPGLLRYNVQDCLVTYRLWEYLTNRIKEDYPETWKEKLSDYAYKWWSDAVWTGIHKEEFGVALDPVTLQANYDSRKQRMDLGVGVGEKIGLTLCGKGSQTSIRDLLSEAADEYGLWDSPDLETTEKTGAISTKDKNISVALAVCKPGPLRQKLNLLRGYRRNLKLVSSYLSPLLYGRGKDHADKSSVLIDGIVYPSWYITPSSEKDDSSDSEGGTVQCRWTCKKPALQTNPAEIMRHRTTRFPGGFFGASDLSQIELRVPGILSGDPGFIRMFEDPACDPHSDSTVLVFGPDILKHPDYREVYRQVGKILNFLMLFRGKAEKFHQTVWTEVGIDLPKYRCEEIIYNFWADHEVLRAWQDDLIARALKDGYVQVPLVGPSRIFAGSEKVLRDTYEPTICNLLVQAVAALILESADAECVRRVTEAGMRTGFGLQVYDALYFEGPATEETAVTEMVSEVIVNPPFYRDLCEYTGFKVPLATKTKISHARVRTHAPARENAGTPKNFQEIG